MNQFLKILSFIVLIFNFTLSQAEPNRDIFPTSYVGTTAKANFSTLITPFSAFSVLAEGGPRDLRFNGTLGFAITDNQRIKFTGEYLRQDIKYAFYTGDSRQWVKQGAIGGLYAYRLNQYRYLPEFDLFAGYSHAPNKLLTDIPGFIPNLLNPLGPLGPGVVFVDQRGIAGSDAGYVSPGVSLAPWPTSRAGIALNYDNVQYHTRYALYEQHAKGVGGTFNFNQQIMDSAAIGTSIGIRSPFQVYEAYASFSPRNFPNWAFGIDANYVDGKHGLPNTYNVGLSISYAVTEAHVLPFEKDPSPAIFNNNLATWVSDPAIYIPQVLAIADERVTATALPAIPRPSCIPPSVVGSIAAITITSPSTVTVPTAGVFSSTSPLTYTVSTTAPPTANTSVTVNPTTGVVSVTYTGATAPHSFTVTVTARSDCGAVATTFPVSTLAPD